MNATNIIIYLYKLFSKVLFPYENQGVTPATTHISLSIKNTEKKCNSIFPTSMKDVLRPLCLPLQLNMRRAYIMCVLHLSKGRRAL
jgi:hypothetical protein